MFSLLVTSSQFFHRWHGHLLPQPSTEHPGLAPASCSRLQRGVSRKFPRLAELLLGGQHPFSLSVKVRLKLEQSRHVRFPGADWGTLNQRPLVKSQECYSLSRISVSWCPCPSHNLAPRPVSCLFLHVSLSWALGPCQKIQTNRKSVTTDAEWLILAGASQKASQTELPPKT